MLWLDVGHGETAPAVGGACGEGSVVGTDPLDRRAAGAFVAAAEYHFAAWNVRFGIVDLCEINNYNRFDTR